MRSLFQNNYESENDKRLDKKFSYNYQVIKNMYPKASELPEEEVRKIIQKYYQAPQGQEEQAIKDYIRQKNRSGNSYTDWIMRIKKRWKMRIPFGSRRKTMTFGADTATNKTHRLQPYHKALTIPKLWAIILWII